MADWQRAGDIPGLMSRTSGPPPAPPSRGGQISVGGSYNSGDRYGLGGHALSIDAGSVGLPRPQPALCRRLTADRACALACDQLLSMDVPRACECRSGRISRFTGEPTDDLVRLCRARCAELCRACSEVPFISSLIASAGLFVVDDLAMDRKQSQLQRSAASDHFQWQCADLYRLALAAAACPPSPSSAGHGSRWRRRNGFAATSAAPIARSYSMQRDLEMLWRTLVFVIACAFIIPIPWVLRWYVQMVWSRNSNWSTQRIARNRRRIYLPFAQRAFLRDGSHQRAVLFEDQAAGQAAAALRARRILGVKQPFVGAERPVKPHRVIEARGHHAACRTACGRSAPSRHRAARNPTHRPARTYAAPDRRTVSRRCGSRHGCGRRRSSGRNSGRVRPASARSADRIHNSGG